MAGNIKGITIEIGGETKGLQKALSGVNSDIRETQSELKEVEKALKLDPSNIELLEQKQKALSSAVEATSEKLKTLKEAQQQAADQLARGDIGQEQYDALTREIVKTEDALKKATEAEKAFSAEAEQMKAKLSEVSSAAGKVAEATKVVSAAAAGVVAGIGAMALKSAAAADDLNTLAKQSGLSTEELQKMQYASDLVDVSVDNMVGAQTKLRKSMASTSTATTEAFQKLGVATKASDGQMRSSTDVFYDVLEALSHVGNETERDQLAMDIFGKSADQLAGIIDDGGAALKELGNEAEELGLILDQDTLDSLNAVNDEIDKLKAKAKGQLAKAAANALEALTPVIEDVVNLLSSLLDKIGSLSPGTIEAIAIVGSIVAAISPVANLIFGVTDALSGLADIFPDIKDAFAAVTAFAAANPVLLIIAAVALLATIIIKHWDEIKPVLDAAYQKVKGVIDAVVDWVKGAIETVKTAFNAVRDFFSGIFTAIADTVKEKINSVIEWVNSGIQAINNITQAVNNSGVGKALGINIGSIDTIDTLSTSTSGNAILSQNGRGSGGTFSNNYRTTNNTYYQTSTQPLQVNLNMDSRTLATQMVKPMRTANAAAGSSNLR